MNEVGILYDKLFTLLFTNRSNAVHYGFWKKGIFTFAGAQENENSFLASVAHIKEGDRVLDAGCGVGGSALWLVKNFKVHVTGIALGTREVRHAEKLARKKKLTSHVNFAVMDMSHTSYEKNSFELVWAIESVLYIADKKSTLSEYKRILSPHGKVVIAVLFLVHDAIKEEERMLHAAFSAHSLTAPLPTIAEMHAIFAASGFADVEYIDKRSAVYFTAFIYLTNAVFLFPFVYVLKILSFGLFPSWFVDYTYMAIEQWKGIHSGLFTYGVFVARKK